MSNPKIKTVIQVHPDDNVLVAIQTIPLNTRLPAPWDHVITKQAIPAGHKLALTTISNKQFIYKYGYSIGHATQLIKMGEHIHSHNIKTNLSGNDSYQYNAFDPPINQKQPIPTFSGYLRKNGQVGIRNEVWIINTVGCVNQTAKRISDLCLRRYNDKADAFVALTHPFGCSQLGDDLSNTRKLLASLMQHPNAGGVVVIGLGCENNQLTTLLAEATGLDTDRIRYFNSQEVDDEVEYGIEQVQKLLSIMKHDKRTPQPVTKLALGMKCGGSDGFSGLTANAVVGRISDKLTQYGGRVILTETPEMFGAEQVLMDRSSSKAIFEQTVDLVQNFKQYFIDNQQPIYENPSPGNKAGGLTTLEEKSLGAIQKGGKATVNEIIAYGEKASVNTGLTLLEGPGNDAVSSTALAAAGASIILFTTGRGTPLGFPVPTVKISSNSGIYHKKPHWIDFNAGKILDTDINIDQCADELFEYLLEVASGKLTNNEINENREIAIWKNGVTL